MAAVARQVDSFPSGTGLGQVVGRHVLHNLPGQDPYSVELATIQQHLRAQPDVAPYARTSMTYIHVY